MVHSIVQVIPQEDFKVICYFDDGIIKMFDVKPFLNKGIFKKLSDIEVFKETCTVLNNTLAWDLEGNFDPYNCIDLDPESIYSEGKSIKDPLIKTA